MQVNYTYIVFMCLKAFHHTKRNTFVTSSSLAMCKQVSQLAEDDIRLIGQIDFAKCNPRVCVLLYPNLSSYQK